MLEIWFWQQIISPHMAELAVALSEEGNSVFYVMGEGISEARRRQGWSIPAMPGVNVVCADGKAVPAVASNAADNSIHLCEGVRANGHVGVAQRYLTGRGHKQWILMETINDAGLFGILKRVAYRQLLNSPRIQIQGVLATGYRTSAWVAARGVLKESIFDFAYFLPPPKLPNLDRVRRSECVRFIYVGQLISRKRVEWLLEALATLHHDAFEVWVVGDGPRAADLKESFSDRLAHKLRWLGPVAMGDVPALIAQADCLVLPSKHDGWGAVGSEALMVGTPVICSDKCGVAGAVNASGVGGVFISDNRALLQTLIHQQILKGRVGELQRSCLARWAKCLSAKAGADYLQSIIQYSNGENDSRPIAPWLRVSASPMTISD